MTKGLFRSLDTRYRSTKTESIGDDLALSVALESKRNLCIELLREFGVTDFRENRRESELTHRCVLPIGRDRHSDGNSWTASVNYSKLKFNCYVCGYGGPIDWWVAVNRGLDTEGAQAWLGQRVGSGHKEDLPTRLAILNSILHPPDDSPGPMPFYNDAILNRWNEYDHHPYLTDSISEGGREVPSCNLDKYEVGYAADDEDFHYYGRIIIPVRWNGKIVGWQARRFDPDDPEYGIKYKNSPSFPRNRILYGDIGGRSPVIVESPLSVLRHTHQRPIISTFGSEVTQAQLRLLEKYSSLTLFPDPDKAGRGWARNIYYKLSRSVRINIVDSPYAKVDPADLDEDTYVNLVDSAVPGSIWTPKPYHELVKYN